MRKLLVVDDNIDFLQRLSALLQTDFEVYQAVGLVEAWDVFNKTSINCVCSDYNLRDGTGIDLLKKLRKAKVNCPFLLMSGNDDRHLTDIAERYDAMFCCKTDIELLQIIRTL